ncbi:MAG: ammonium transporter [Lachnospiraceae bacterium]|nr:ammonium transporter [Lachnospiraceae bacterium]MDY3276274.1 ammonium transporter [Agathobacter sp.]MDY5102130.1 ammonium transporter [Agathobacter sp.]
MTEEVMSFITDNIFGIWFLIGAALVFWMQAGFAMVEAGFTRAKNSGNILMKNLMDFCIGTVVFILIGFSLLLGEDILGFIGKPGFDIFTAYADFDFSNFVFNLVFCATTATIVSGAMAERTKFLSYCIYSAVISALIYPIEAHWIWGGGWLAQLGFHDFAGSCAIHMVGGISALIGAKILGPRIGKFTKDKSGKIVKVNAFPGHNLPLGCLGCFILWFGWYGFNGAACTDGAQLASVFLTTTVAPAVATVVCMIFTWIKYGKPDVSMCLNASLAGLVAITAPCDVTDCLGAAIIGFVAGLLVVFGVWLLDYKLHVDDPVGAVAVHMMNGIWGTIAVGLFATETAPGFAMAGITEGLFYGGGFKLLGLQLLGVLTVGAWAAIMITITFFVIKAVIGLRVSEEEEITGLDATEHGLPSAYAGFSIMDVSDSTMDVNENTDLGAPEYETASAAKKDAAVKVVSMPHTESGMYKVVIIAKLSRYDQLKKAMNDLGVTGMTCTQVMGCGIQKGSGSRYRGAELDATLLPKIKVEVVVSKIPVENVIEAAKKALYTGHIGDGKIFVYDVAKVVKVRTGEEDIEALQDVE